MNTKSGYRLLYADPEDGEFIDMLAEAMRMSRKQVIGIATSLLALLVLAPDQVYQLFSEVLRDLEKREGRSESRGKV